jgi:cyclic pyranopterin phosphate synthase
MSPQTARLVESGEGPKGEVLGVARLAGVNAAKQTGLLIPLAHPLPLTFADVEASVDAEAGVVELVAEARTVGRTGVEMEAMTACAVAALTVYDMVKGGERGVARGGRPAREERRPLGLAPGGGRLSMRAALLTVSSSRAAGGGADESGERLAALAAELGLEVEGREVLPDEQATIAARLTYWADEAGVALILTSGGTGFSPDDVTPEATREVLDREAPGIAEAMRNASRPHTANWMLSRAVAGIRGSTLIVNFPGSPRSIDQTAAALVPALPHALALLAGRRPPHGGS